ncbi:hypothetical protein MMC13_007504 [Lambiella insularis]|nr:hypothetical protein [Lambiella insularis]
MTSATDLKTYATSTIDFYTLLSLPVTFSQHELDRAWRRTALKYHPDKVGADLVAAEKFHLAQIGYDILSDPTVKTLYDNARNAREQKERARKMFEGERKRMREDLESREERGTKRAREEEDFEKELHRLAEDGRRRRREREAGRRREMMEEQAAANDGYGTTATTTTHPPVLQHPHATTVAELDRSIKVRWCPVPSFDLDKDRLTSLFSRFGKVESAFLMKSKTRRVGPSREKKEVATGVIVFTSVVSAHTAVMDAQKQTGPEWSCIEGVSWASDKEPAFLAEMKAASPSPSPRTPAKKVDATLSNGGSPESTKVDGGVRRVPSFASFSPAALSTPKALPLGSAGGSPSLEEFTMIRLREAEKRRLEAEIVRRDEEAGVSTC